MNWVRPAPAAPERLGVGLCIVLPVLEVHIVLDLTAHGLGDLDTDRITDLLVCRPRAAAETVMIPKPLKPSALSDGEDPLLLPVGISTATRFDSRRGGPHQWPVRPGEQR